MSKLKILSILFFVLVLSCLHVNAGGVPQRLHFQAIARDTKGALVVSTRIQVRLSVIDSADAGKLVYREYQTPVTDAYGTIDIQVNDPDSSVQIGSTAFVDIPWQTGNKWLKIEYQATLGPSYTLIGLFPLLPVPYSMVSQTALSVDGVDLTNPKDGDVLKYNAASGKWVHGQDNGANYYAGNGIKISTGDTLTNSAPDQIISLKGTGTSKVSGSYPNFTIHSDSAKALKAGTGMNFAGDSFSNISSMEFAMLGDTETYDGGTSSTGWQTRILNITFASAGSSIKLGSSNTFSLKAGVYLIDGSAPGIMVGSHFAVVYDVTNSQTVILGSSEHSSLYGAYASNRSFFKGVVVVTKTTTYRIDHYVDSGGGTNSLGEYASGKSPNLYTQVFIQKLR